VESLYDTFIITVKNANIAPSGGCGAN